MSQKFPFGRNVSIDTRTLSEGDVFFALIGEFSDGHDYVAQALDKGASLAVVNFDYKAPANLDERVLFRVQDPLEALTQHAKSHLNEMPAKRIALTGSSGKTTTKELIRCVLAACLESDFVTANTGNLNNHIGVPLTALLVQPHHKAAIFELGMNHFGEIEHLTKLVSPHIGLITNIGSAHAGNLGGLDGVERAKGELFENLDERSVALVNADDPRCVRVAQSIRSPKMLFGTGENCDLRLLDCQIDTAHAGLKLRFGFAGKEVDVSLPMLGLHNAQNATAALAVACAMDLDFEKAALGLQNIGKIKGRLKQTVLGNGAVLIDDTYNANPDSMRAGLQVLAELGRNRRKVAILGEMGELGDAAEKSHTDLGAYIAKMKIDLLYACGALGRLYIDGAQSHGFDLANTVWAQDSFALSEKLDEICQPHDVVLVKGSRSTKMENVVNHILSQNKGI